VGNGRKLLGKHFAGTTKFHKLSNVNELSIRILANLSESYSITLVKIR